MTQDVADDLLWNTRIDLPRSVAMTKDMGAKDRRDDPYRTGSNANDVSYGRRSDHRSIWCARTEKHRVGSRSSWAAMTKIVHQRTRNRRKERQDNLHSRLGAANKDGCCSPIKITKAQRSDLGRTEAVGGHHQEERVVAPTDATVTVNGTDDRAHVAPWKSTWRTVGTAVAWRENGRGEVVLQPPSCVQKTKKCAQAATHPCNRLHCKTVTQIEHERIDIFENETDAATPATNKSQKCINDRFVPRRGRLRHPVIATTPRDECADQSAACTWYGPRDPR